jgi:hypothetical protein
MAKKKNKNRNKKLLILIGVVVFILFFIVFLKQKQTFKYQIYQKAIPTIIPTATPSPSVREYHSKFLKIRFMVPSEFEISELDNDIALKSKIGEASIERIGTNNDSIEGYLFGLSDLNKLEITDKQKVKINGMDVIICKIKSNANDNPERRSYFFYPTLGTIFVISTRSQELFGELDQIAQSFRYEP